VSRVLAAGTKAPGLNGMSHRTRCSPLASGFREERHLPELESMVPKAMPSSDFYLTMAAELRAKSPE